mgnify:CR=1 FL=1
MKLTNYIKYYYILDDINVYYTINNFIYIIIMKSKIIGGILLGLSYFNNKKKRSINLNRKKFYNSWQNFDDIISYIEKLDPSLNIISETIGKTYEGKDIMVFKRGVDKNNTNKPITLIIGTQHAREWLSPLSCVYILEHISDDILSSNEIHVIPVVNVDGYIYSRQIYPRWRKNRQPNNDGSIGTDLNRNWGYKWGLDSGSSNKEKSYKYRGSAPFSTPEIASLRDYIAANDNPSSPQSIGDRMHLFIDIHTYTAVVTGIWTFTENFSNIELEQSALGKNAVNKMNNITDRSSNYYEYLSNFFYLVSGGSVDWTSHICNCWSFVFELGPETSDHGGFFPPESTIFSGCQEALAGVESLINQTAGKKPPDIDQISKNREFSNFKKPIKKLCRCGEDMDEEY